MKKKGSIFIETIVGVNIILSMFLIVALLIGENIKSSFRRKEIEEANRIIYCIMQEVKYNMTMEEILALTNTSDLKLEVYDDFIFDLSRCDLGAMPKGDEIIIKAISTEDPNKVDIKIEIILDTKDESLDRRFSKYRWMDYYE
ncbi:MULTISPECIES: hypothetical protein [unclassified Clostridium]|uniref:hypothetical protein n=1 Tax=Clostridium TaxID=1485 RepID=UPI001C8C60A4|nr:MULTISPECIES: hypothetical protein [unclassified Clostridium]MBX9136015.1 hypothetical protein [Clostridium sp. K12(2020)]MBX9142745.1 hypothetical protein [Clostridium sp. K13]MDU2289301.1 hypothetical protein [Clostridium celatum]